MTGTAVRTKGRMRSALGWLAIAAAVVVLVLLTGALSFGSPNLRGGLDPESPRGSGALAIAELLRNEGFEITIVRSRAEAIDAIDDDSTLVMTDPYTLSDEAVSEVLEPANNVVFLSSSSRLLRLLDLGDNTGPPAAEQLRADCDLPELANVGTVRPDRFFIPADGVTGCFTEDDAAGMLVDDRGGIRVVLVSGMTLFTNDHLAENGNAALALALLGQTDDVVWYVPSFYDSDLESASPDTMASLTPDWVTPAIMLLFLAGIVAGIARGQRFGPLVTETLPVTVRASETMHGRARLTAKAADSAHAADAIRVGTLRRLAARLGLTARSDPTQIADAASDRLRIPRGALQQLLAGPLPENDSELTETARRLAELEAAVDTAVHVEREKL